MPLIFQKSSHHYPKPHFSSAARTLNNSNDNNNDTISQATMQKSESFSQQVAAGRTCAPKRHAFRSAIQSFSSERTGGWLQRRWRDMSRLAKNPRLIVPYLKNLYKKWHLKHLMPLIFVVIYMLAGAFIFLWLEEASEKEQIAKRNAKIRRERSMFIKRVDEILVDRATVTQYALRRHYVEEALDHLHAQLAIGKDFSEVTQGEWSLTTAMYYAGTIFTTIGYGDIVCSTIWGQIVTVIYAILGIPIMLFTLNHLGKFLYKWINEVVAICSLMCGQICCRKARQEKHARMKNNSSAIAIETFNSAPNLRSNNNNYNDDDESAAIKKSIVSAPLINFTLQ